MTSKHHLKKGAKFTLAILIAAAAGAAGRGIWRYLDAKESEKLHQQAEAEAYNSLVPADDTLTVEYGINPDFSTLFPEGVQLEETKTEEDSFRVTARTADSYGTEVERESTIRIHYVDTTPPEINLKKDEAVCYQGDGDCIFSLVESVKDAKDGSLKNSQIPEKGTWNVDLMPMSEPGEADVTIKAMDRAGNENEKSIHVTVLAVPSYPYKIEVNRAANTVNVYQMDTDGEYTIPYKAFVCSTGPSTPLGTYSIGEKYRWRALFGNVYGQYACHVTGNILFHSVPYYAPDASQLESEEYNKLGTAASMGCVRLSVIDELWIYSSCPSGTVVEFYDDADNPGPLGKPESIHIDLSDERSGWDPTDPDPENPWN